MIVVLCLCKLRLIHSKLRVTGIHYNIRFVNSYHFHGTDMLNSHKHKSQLKKKNKTLGDRNN